MVMSSNFCLKKHLQGTQTSCKKSPSIMSLIAYLSISKEWPNGASTTGLLPVLRHISIWKSHRFKASNVLRAFQRWRRQTECLNPWDSTVLLRPNTLKLKSQPPVPFHGLLLEPAQADGWLLWSLPPKKKHKKQKHTACQNLSSVQIRQSQAPGSPSWLPAHIQNGCFHEVRLNEMK